MDSIAQITTSSGAKESRHFVKIVAATAALAGLLFGFDTGVISGAILFIKGEFGLTPFAEELLVSAALIGAVCGSILSGRLTDLIGRKRAILINSVRNRHEHRSTDRGANRDRCCDWRGFLYRSTLHR
jgi:uncharacterized membrane protein